MTTVTVAASRPSRNSDLALNMSWLRMSLPSGSVPSGWLRLGGAGCRVSSKAYPTTGSYIRSSHTVFIRMGCAAASSA